MKPLLVAVVLFASCSGPRSPDGVDIFAASSLTAVFEDLAPTASFNFAASSLLVRQVADGAEADVLATADLETMATAGRYVHTSVPFARNRPVIAVGRDVSKPVKGPADLEGLVVAVCAPDAPCGRLATGVLADVRPGTVTVEENVKAVLQRVLLGEADAGIVYASDVVGSTVDAVDIPDAPWVIPSVAVVRSSDRQRQARAFITLLRSQAGRDVLQRHGFDLLMNL